MKTKKVENVEYWLEGVFGNFMVTKEDFYNPYQNRRGFKVVKFDDGSQNVYYK